MSTIKKVIEELVIDPPKQTEKKLKILIVGAEAAPYASVGGFASVLGYLSRALKSRGHEVRIFMPKFGSIDEDKYGMKMLYQGLRVPTGDENNPELICNIKHVDDPEFGVPTFFLENMEYYEKRANVYGYSDDATRWALLSRGVLEFIRTEKFVPDVIHCNDWHTGLVSNYLKTEYENDTILGDIATVFTIHNLAYQGMFNHKYVNELDYDDGRSPIASFFDDRLNNLNFMRRGIIYSDSVNTVSKTYAKEILTPEYGEGLERLLLEVREKVFGIVNGVDYEEFNPKTDELIEKNYDIKSLKSRIKNKAALQEEFDLPVDPDIPVLGFVGRLAGQKGIDMMVNTLTHVLEDFNVQFVQVGGGEGYFADMFLKLQEQYPDKVGIHPYPNFTLPRLLFAGTDVMLLPSRFEPCGIVQIESMRYGSIPIVRKVGGLADTVTNFDVATGEGTGFVFTNFSEFSLFGQIVRAIELYRNKEIWQKIQVNAMSKDLSWEYSAGEYAKLYRIAMNFKQQQEIRGGIIAGHQ